MTDQSAFQKESDITYKDLNANFYLLQDLYDEKLCAE